MIRVSGRMRFWSASEKEAVFSHIFGNTPVLTITSPKQTYKLTIDAGGSAPATMISRLPKPFLVSVGIKLLAHGSNYLKNNPIGIGDHCQACGRFG